MQPQIIGGRDGKGGGTWLAISESGRLAFLTNFREPGKERPGAVSRGQLPTLFLQSSLCPTDYLEGVAARAGDFNGFNLIVADTNTGEMAYLSNRPLGQPIAVKQVRCLNDVTPFSLMNYDSGPGLGLLLRPNPNPKPCRIRTKMIESVCINR